MARPKLLLLDDVDKLGRKGDIVEPRAGYARNFLLPQQMALIATKQSIRMQERLQEELRQQAIQDRKDSEAIAAKLDGQSFTIEVKVDPEGHMYGSVSAADIARLVVDTTGIQIERKNVSLLHAIKVTGMQKLTIKLKEDVACAIEVVIMPEGGFPEPAVAPATEGQEGQPDAEGHGGHAKGGGVHTR